MLFSCRVTAVDMPSEPRSLNELPGLIDDAKVQHFKERLSVNDGQRCKTMQNDAKRWLTMVNDGQRWFKSVTHSMSKGSPSSLTILFTCFGV
jgi:hypothetical protein